MVGLSDTFKFRDVFHRGNVSALAAGIEAQWSGFDVAAFMAAVFTGFEGLGMMERNVRICEALEAFLPDAFPRAVSYLIGALGPELPNPGETEWDAFIVMPQCLYVSRRGKAHFELSMTALYEMTKRLSAETELRTFIALDYDRAMGLLHDWVTDPSPHVRRLVSEGTRPRLPLAPRILRFQKDPAPVIALLAKLKADPSLYVRRSVANNLNDMSKDHPEMVVDVLVAWQTGAGKETQWLIKHAARTLLKQGHARALALFGYRQGVDLASDIYLHQDRLAIGETLVFDVVLENKGIRSEKLMLDYVIFYRKASGKQLPKVFKWTCRTLNAGEVLRLSRRQALVSNSARTLYPGPHRLVLQINGLRYGEASFEVTVGEG